MFRKLSLTALGLGATLVLGCSSDNNGPAVDLSLTGDLSGSNTDQGTGLNYMVATPHDVDTGVVPVNTAVKMTGLVVINPPSSFASSHMMKCTFEAIAQDPNCNTAPCGLAVHIITNFVPRSTTDTTHCVYADKSTTFFANTKVGDTIDITGTVDSFQMQGQTIVSHSITTDSVTASATMGKVTPIAVTIAASGDMQFQNGTGTGWQQYEGTSIKVSPASGFFTVTSETKYNFTTDPGGVYWGSANYFIYDSKDMGVSVAQGSTWKSITGSVDVSFGGQINPVFKDDFVPYP
jgi:hypothetical protein